jgi:hypothetical protein
MFEPDIDTVERAYRRGVNQTIEQLCWILFDEYNDLADDVMNLDLFFDILRDESYEMRYEKKNYPIFLHTLFLRAIKKLHESGLNTIEAIEGDIEKIILNIDKKIIRSEVQNAQIREHIEALQERMTQIEKRRAENE